MGKYSSITLTGCGAAAVSLLLFAGCDDPSGGEDQPTTSETVETETPGATTLRTETPGLTTLSIPDVSPPSRSSSAVDTEVCGMRGVPCTETTTSSDTSEPSPQPEPSESAG